MYRLFDSLMLTVPPAGFDLSVGAFNVQRLLHLLLLQPRFPAPFEHEHVGELRFLAQAAGNFPAGIATQAAAIDDDFFAWRPHRQELRQQFIPPVFIQ